MDERPRDDGGGGGIAARAGELNRDPKYVEAMRKLRRVLPGDSRFGDPLSTAGEKQSQLVGRRISELTAERPSVLAEAGLGALQVWQAMAEGVGRGRGESDLAIVFTDLIDFSSWALEAGDEATLALLRDVGEAIEPPMRDHGGQIVKRLGDGMMVVFRAPADAVSAVTEARERLSAVEAPGYEPRIRAGMHFGRPRKIGDDYVGVDVNIAARVTEAASAGEMLVSGRALESLDTDSLKARRKLLFRAKGVPDDVTVYSIKPR